MVQILASLLLAGLVRSPGPAPVLVRGTVMDAQTAEPLAGAFVTWQATSVRDTTGTDGRFVLRGLPDAPVVIVAAKKGYYSGSVVTTAGRASALQIALDHVPAADDPDYPFVDPGLCSVCHPAQHQQWTGSPMQKAGGNTWVYDVYDGTGTPGGHGGFVYTRDSIHAPSNPASECAACHQPEPWVRDPFRALEDVDQLSTGALHGISCEICHKIAGIDESRTNYPGIFPGVVTLTRPSSPEGQVEYGVLGDADYRMPGLMRPSYQPQLVAAVCAACHQDKNDPDQDGDFEEPDGVISEPTYIEWLESDYGNPASDRYRTCVDCHMPPFGSPYVCSMDGPERDPETVRSHRIVGTTPGFLENAVTMGLQCEVVDGEVRAIVSLTNDGTGHHVPTGVTIRNMILLVEASRIDDGLELTRTSGTLVGPLGGVGDPALGCFADRPGKLFAKVNHDASGAGPAFFTEATGILYDNRIPALATDVSTYSFAVPPGGGTLRVHARLVYRRSWRALVDAKGWTNDGHGAPLEDLLPPHFGHLMEEREWTAVVSGEEEEPIGASRVSLRARPNPARGAVELSFRLDKPAQVSLRIYDVQGRRVDTILEGWRGNGAHRVRWDARDGQQQPVASGVYVLRLERDGQAPMSRRFVVVR